MWNRKRQIEAIGCFVLAASVGMKGWAWELGVHTAIIAEDVSSVGRAVQDIADLGAGWMKDAVRYEGKPFVGTAQWKRMAALCKASAGAGVSLMVRIGGYSKADAAVLFDPKARWGLYKEFVGEVVDTCGMQVSAWELGNEPDLESAYGKEWLRRLYENRLAELYRLVKERCGGCLLLSPGFNKLDDEGWLVEFIEHNEKVRVFDIFSFHGYRFPFGRKEAPENGSGSSIAYAAQLEGIRAAAARLGVRARLSNSEVGYPIFEFPSGGGANLSSDDQVRYVQRMLLLDWALGLEHTIYYEYQDRDPEVVQKFGDKIGRPAVFTAMRKGAGLVDREYHRKRVYEGVKAIAQLSRRFWLKGLSNIRVCGKEVFEMDIESEDKKGRLMWIKENKEKSSQECSGEDIGNVSEAPPGCVAVNLVRGVKIEDDDRSQVLSDPMAVFCEKDSPGARKVKENERRK